MYVLKICVISNDSVLKDLYRKAVNKINDDEYKNNPYKDAGFDIFTPTGDVEISPGETKLVDLQIQCAAYKIVCDENTCVKVPTAFFMYPRSSIYKTYLRLANNTGIIDSGYRGNLMGAFDNISRIGPTFQTGKWCQNEQEYGRLLQICMPDLSPFSVEMVTDSDDTMRGTGGLGSTGF